MPLFISFFTAARRRLRHAGFWAALLLFPVSMALCGLLLPPEQLDKPFEIGLCPSPNSPTAQQLITQLLALEDGPVRFVPAQPEAARMQVESGRWDCAFLPRAQFEAALMEGEPLFTVLCTSGSVLVKPAQEVIAAALLKERTADLAGQYLVTSGLLPGLTSTQAAEQIRGALYNNAPMELIVETIAGEPLPTLSSSAVAPLIHGLMGIFLFSDALLAAAELRDMRRSAWYRRALPVAGAAVLTAPPVLERALLPALPAGAALVVACFHFSGLQEPLYELALLLFFRGALIPLSLVLSRIPSYEQLVPLLIPYLTVSCATLCPMLWDIGHLIPGLRPLSRMLPPAWYLLAAGGDGLLWLWAGGLVCCCAALLLELFLCLLPALKAKII